jgi:hypothetical protein
MSSITTSTTLKKLSIASAGAILVLSGIIGKAQHSTADEKTAVKKPEEN